MKLINSAKTAFTGLLAHKSRTALTILGIVIGITAIILISAVGKGAQNIIVGQIQSLGSNIIAVIPGREPTGPTDPAAAETILSDSLKARELEALQRKTNVPKVSEIIPLVFSVESVSYEGETFRPMILGSSELIADIFDLTPQDGAFFSKNDIDSKASVAVIGSRIEEELFGSSNAVGQKIRVNNRNLRVIGVLPPKGQILFVNFDEAVMIPYTTAQQYIFGIKHFNRLIVQVKDEADIPQTVQDIEITLRSLHNIDDPDNDDFFVSTPEELSDTLGSVLGAVTLFLSLVAAIALIVGGIGIMNIMLVSITERTREIGLRRSLGATRKNILAQFLFEAIVLTVTGGIIGIILGVLLSIAVSFALTKFLDTPWIFAFPLSAAIVGLVVSSLIGLIFGIYPARKAAEKDPIEALKYE